MKDKFVPLVEILKDRHEQYGDHLKGVEVRENIMDMLHSLHVAHRKRDMTLVESGFMYDIVNKLCRIAVTPRHLDSWQDIAGYAELTVKSIRKLG